MLNGSFEEASLSQPNKALQFKSPFSSVSTESNAIFEKSLRVLLSAAKKGTFKDIPLNELFSFLRGEISDYFQIKIEKQLEIIIKL